MILDPAAPVVVVGASLAGVRAAQALRREGHTGALTVIGAEQHWPPYDRPPLSKQVLTGALDAERARLRLPDGLGVEVVLGRRATGLDLRRGEVTGDDGSSFAFDGLVVATGATPRALPGTGGLAGVHLLRTVDDVARLRAELASATRVAIVGAGFIGCEVASSCRSLGLDVTLVDALDPPLGAVLGATAGGFVRQQLLANGVRLHLGSTVAAVEGAGRARKVVLADGTEIDTDVVVVGIGVTPATEWLEGSGLQLRDGVVCDEACRALGGDGRVVAAGDVARWDHPRYGSLRTEHWTNAGEQAAHAVRALVHGPAVAGPYAPTPYFWSDQFGVKLQFVGIARPGDEVTVAEGSVEEGRFVLAYGRDGVTVGALCVGCPRRLVEWQALVDARAAYPPPVLVP